MLLRDSIICISVVLVVCKDSGRPGDLARKLIMYQTITTSDEYTCIVCTRDHITEPLDETVPYTLADLLFGTD